MSLEDKRTYTKLDIIVNSVLADKQYGQELYELFLHYALKIHRKLNRQGYFGFKTEEVTPTSYNVIVLPKNCIEWISLSVLKGVHLYSYVRSWSIINKFKELDKEGVLANLLKYHNEIEQYQFIGEVNEEGWEIGQLFGMRPHYNVEGYYQYDRDKREIYIKPLSSPTGRLFLSYISDCENAPEEIMVHQNFEDAYYAFIDWQYHEHSDERDLSRKAPYKKQLYEQEMDALDTMEMDLSIEDIEEVYFNSFSLVPLL